MSSNLKKLFLNPYALFFLALALGILLLYTYVLNPKPAEIGQVIGAQTMLNEKGELVVKYAFVSGTIDTRISENVKQIAKKSEVVPIKEDIAKRTSSSRTFLTNKPSVRLVEFVSGEQYFKDDKGNWWQADYKTTTPEEFSKLPKTPQYARHTRPSKLAIIKKALATTITSYPQASKGGSNITSDEGVQYNSAATWATAHDATAGNIYVGGAENATTMLFGGETTGGVFYIYRSIMSFDTRVLTSADTISSATISLWSTTANQNIETTYPSNPQIVGATPAANNSFVLADYDQLGTTTFVDSPPSLTTFVGSSAYHDFTLNASGISNITKGGVSVFGLRATNDINNTAPTARSYGRAFSADNTGTTNDPKLVLVVTDSSLTSINGDLSTSLQACWELDETSGTRVDAFGANDLTDNNTVTSNTGKQSNAAQFTYANSESLSITDNASLSMSNADFTVAAWVYMDTKANSGRVIIAKGDVLVSGNSEYALYYNTGVDRFRFFTSSNGTTFQAISADSLGSPSTATLYLVIAWYDATNDTVNIQVNNGVVDSAIFTGGGFDGTQTFRLGWDGSAGWYMDGRIDVAAVWKRKLSVGERAGLYASGNGIPCTAVAGASSSIFKDGIIFKDGVIIEQ